MERPGVSLCDGTTVANPAVVCPIPGTVGQATCAVTTTSQSANLRIQSEVAPSQRKTDPDSRTCIGKTLRQSQISERTSEIMLSAWKSGTHKQYSVYIRKWNNFCIERQIDCVKPNVTEVLDFLTYLFDEGLGYSALNTARSALSQIIVWKGYCTIGSHPWVTRFLRAVYNLRPPVPRYKDTWDVAVLLHKLRSMSPVRYLSLKDLTFKTVTLVTTLLAARAQTLTLLDLNNMTHSKSEYSFTVGTADLKQSRPGYTPPVVRLKAYAVDKGICVYRALSEYLSRTKPLRQGETRLFISYVSPHKAVTSSTISHWVKTMLSRADIDTLKYSAHSVRSASSSKALKAGASLDDILNTAGWSSATTFAKFYNKKIVSQSAMAIKILSS